MIASTCRPHDRLQFRTSEIGAPNDVAALPWAEAGIARLVPTRLGVELRVGPYVGRLVIPGKAVIDIEEPYPGTVAACLDLSRTGKRAGDQPSPPTRTLVAPWAALAEGFVQELSEYVMHGIERRYSDDAVRTSRPRGRIEVTMTAKQLRGRGRTNQIICRPRDLTDDTPFNRVVVAAVARAEQVLLRERQDQLLRKLRTVAQALAGVRRDLLPDFWAARLSASQARTDHARLLSLSELLVRGIPAMPRYERTDITYPMSAWLNVERIFEEAIRTVTEDIVGSRGSVRKGQGDGVKIFERGIAGDGEALMKSADPDVVIRYSDRVLLMDAKYRRHEADFTDSELYQLIAHAGAYGAAAAALVAPCHPGQSSEIRWLGSDKNGTVYYLVILDPASPVGIYEGIKSWLDTCLRQP